MRKISGEDAYPLVWPEGTPRRPAHKRERSRFDTSFFVARKHLFDQLRLLGARYVVLSTNIPLRRDGLPYASARNPDDPAVAVYFDFDGEQMGIGCDKWDLAKDNLRALGKTVECIRGIARYGSTDMMRRAVHAFKMLPDDGTNWQGVLGADVNWGAMSREEQLQVAKARYRDLAEKAHPDRGGSEHEMMRLNKAWETARKELGA